MKLQQNYLECQYQCISMKVSWSTAGLGPVLLSKFQTGWDDGATYAEAGDAARRVLDIVRESTVAAGTCSLYHTDAIRATTTLLQILLRISTQEPDKIGEIVAACREGIVLCRSLVPGVLTKAEDTIETILNGHVKRWEAGLLQPPEPLPYLPDAPGVASVSDEASGQANFKYPELMFPFDNTPMDHLFNNDFQDGLQFSDQQFHQFGLFEGVNNEF